MAAMERWSIRMMGLGLVLALLTGCPAAALLGPRPSLGRGPRASYGQGAGGELWGAYHASFDRTWDATVQSLEALELEVVNARKEPFGGDLEARLPDGKTAKLTLLPKGNHRTLVRIRVGTLPDPDASKQIAKGIGKEIEKRLYR